MREIINKLSGREITMIITSAGGIVLAGILMWMLWKTSSNHIEHNTAALLQQAVTNEKVSGSLDRLTSLLDKKLK